METTGAKHVVMWAAAIGAGLVVAFTIGFVWQALGSGRIVFQGKEFHARASHPVRFWLWIVGACVWCVTIITLALPVMFG